MFTGIVQGTAEVVSVTDKDEFRQIVIALPMNLSEGLSIGASVAINGCCLTIVGWKLLANSAEVTFDVVEQTLKLTNICDLAVGDQINIERAARIGDEIGGHLMSGHIATTAEVAQLVKTEDNCRVRLRIDKQWMKYILDKGFVGIDGCSLTIAETVDNGLFVYLIPETLRVTTFSELRVGTRVNIEIDAQTQTIVDTVEQLASKGKINLS